jgi:hypothetical protein
MQSIEVECCHLEFNSRCTTHWYCALYEYCTLYEYYIMYEYCTLYEYCTVHEAIQFVRICNTR